MTELTSDIKIPSLTLKFRNSMRELLVKDPKAIDPEMETDPEVLEEASEEAEVAAVAEVAEVADPDTKTMNT